MNWFTWENISITAIVMVAIGAFLRYLSGRTLQKQKLRDEASAKSVENRDARRSERIENDTDTVQSLIKSLQEKMDTLLNEPDAISAVRINREVNSFKKDYEELLIALESLLPVFTEEARPLLQEQVAFLKSRDLPKILDAKDFEALKLSMRTASKLAKEQRDLLYGQ